MPTPTTAQRYACEETQQKPLQGAPALERSDNVGNSIGQRHSISVAADTTQCSRLARQRERHAQKEKASKLCGGENARDVLQLLYSVDCIGCFAVSCHMHVRASCGRGKCGQQQNTKLRNQLDDTTCLLDLRPKVNNSESMSQHIRNITQYALSLPRDEASF